MQRALKCFGFALKLKEGWWEGPERNPVNFRADFLSLFL